MFRIFHSSAKALFFITRHSFASTSNSAHSIAINASKEAMKKLGINETRRISGELKVSNPVPGAIPSDNYNRILKQCYSAEDIKENAKIFRSPGSGVW